MYSRDDINFKKRIHELVEDGYIVFDKFGRWRVTEKGLTFLIAYAERPIKVSALHDRN
jgi:predicted transcriptional regulator